MLKTNPIFIIGAPRSGTSLLRVMLNRHPAIALCDETYFFYYVYDRRGAFGDVAVDPNRRYLIKRYLATGRIRRLGLDTAELSQKLMSEGGTYADLFASLLRFYAAAKGKVRFGEKTPQHAFFAEDLCALYPDCKILHITRDPRDVVVSLMQMPWGSRSARVNARTWLACQKAALKVAHRENYLSVCYERLVDDAESELRRICAFIGEEYTPAMVETRQPAAMDKWWFQRAQGAIERDRVAQWRGRLTTEQVQVIESVVGKHLEECGYRRATAGCPPLVQAAAIAEQVRCFITERLRRFPRYIYYWMFPTRAAAEESWLERPISGWTLGRVKGPEPPIPVRMPSPPPAPRSPST